MRCEVGRHGTTLRIDGNMLRKILKDHDLNFSDRAKEYGVSKQAINSWFSTNRVPPRALLEMAIDLKLSKEELDQIIVSVKNEEIEKKKWKNLS